VTLSGPALCCLFVYVLCLTSTERVQLETVRKVVKEGSPVGGAKEKKKEKRSSEKLDQGRKSERWSRRTEK